MNQNQFVIESGNGPLSGAWGCCQGHIHYFARYKFNEDIATHTNLLSKSQCLETKSESEAQPLSHNHELFYDLIKNLVGNSPETVSRVTNQLFSTCFLTPFRSDRYSLVYLSLTPGDFLA